MSPKGDKGKWIPIKSHSSQATECYGPAGRWREPVAEEGRGAQAPEMLKGRKNGPGEVATLEAQWGDVEQCDGVLNQGPAC